MCIYSYNFVHSLVSFVKFAMFDKISTVSQISSNLPFFALDAFLDIFEYGYVFNDVNISLLLESCSCFELLPDLSLS